MKLKKGSKAAKDYMAKIRAKRGKVGAAPKKKAAIKKAAPKKATSVLKKELKSKGLKLPHGYGVEKRARVGSSNTHVLNDYKKSSSNLYEYENTLIRLNKLLSDRKGVKVDPVNTKKLREIKKGYVLLIKETKTHLRELKKLL